MVFDSCVDNSHYKIVKAIGKNKTVLDVGCGDGPIAEELIKNGCKVLGIEIDIKKAMMVIGASYCSHVQVGDVETIKLEYKLNYFDVILFGDILEHLKNPLNTLKKLKPFLKENGKIIVSLPNIVYWKSRLKIFLGRFDYEEYGMFDKTHLRFFTQKTARKLIENAGFEITKIDYVPSFPFPIMKEQITKIFCTLFAFKFIFEAGKRRAGGT